jgi:hypothetical protein
MPIKIPASAQTAFQGNMSEGSKVELQFPAPAFYVINGDAKLAALKNFQYFGGWACGTDKVKVASENWQNCPYPIPGYATDKLPQTNGSEMEVIAARKLIVAPIGMREYSSIFDPATGNTRRVPPFTKGARPGVQVLCVLAYKHENTINPWAPIMLTAKGYQTNHIKNAIFNWRKAIKPHVQKIVPGASDSVLNLFWMHIGTFGEARKQEIVGAGTNQKTITPIVSYIPENLTEQQVENMYVGEPMAEFMADISAQSQDWLNVFKQQQTNAPAVGHLELEDDNIPEPPPSEDDIPF